MIEVNYVDLGYSSEFFLIEFCRICRICRILSLVIFVFKITKIVFYKFCRFYRIQLGKTRSSKSCVRLPIAESRQQQTCFKHHQEDWSHKMKSQKWSKEIDQIQGEKTRRHAAVLAEAVQINTRTCDHIRKRTPSVPNSRLSLNTNWMRRWLNGDGEGRLFFYNLLIH